jgi:WD40 repeat protein
VWDAETGRLKQQLAKEFGGRFLAISPDGKLLACHGRGKNVALWDMQTGQLQRELVGHLHPVCAAAFSPDGKTLMSGGEDRTVRLWHVRTGRLLATFMILPSGKEGEASPDWMVYTPEGYYEGSKNVSRFIRWRVGKDLHAAERHERSFHCPVLVQQALEGER